MATVRRRSTFSLADIQDGNHAVNVHKSAQEIGVYVMCGTIPKK